jgi:Spy/CpxP family protein refolding chaperone
MNRSIKTLLIAAAVAGGVAATAVYAAPPGGGACGYGNYGAGFGPGMGGRGGMDSEAHVERLAARLDLSTEQRDQVRAIVDKARPETRALQDKLTDNRQQLHALMRQGTAKESEIRKLADAQGKLKADMIVQRSKVHNAINAVLTPEQREQFQQMGPRRGPSMGGPRGG